MFRSIVEWFKQSVIRTAFAELSSDLETAGAVVGDPPLLTLEVESTPALAKPKGRKATKK